MRVKMLKTMANAVYGTHGAGTVVDLPEDEARRRIAAGDAAAVDEPDRPAAQPASEPRRSPAPPADPGPAAPDPAEVPIDKMTVPQLQKYAADHGIDLNGASLKKDILAKIEAAQDSDE